MPIYEFVCENCGNEFEKILSFSNTTTPACPTCAAVTVTRRVGRPAIHFKGSGWYINDSKKSADSNGSAKKSGDGSETVTDEAAKADSSGKESASTESKKSEATKSESTKSESSASESTKTKSKSESA